MFKFRSQSMHDAAQSSFVVRGCLVAIIGALYLAGCASIDSGQLRVVADRIIVNGKIYTANSEESWVEALAIKDGWIVAAGTTASIQDFADPNTPRDDLGGAFAMPGMHDAHFHTHTAVMQALACSPGQFSPDKLLTVLRWCKENQSLTGEWMVIFGLEMWGEPVNKNEVDLIFPETPVLIYDVSLHNGLANAKALAIAGIDRNSTSPQGGQLGTDPNTGELTGMLIEDPAMQLVTRKIPDIPAASFKSCAEQIFRNMFRYGITSFQDAASGALVWPLVAELERAGTPVPYVFVHLGWHLHDGEPIAELDTAISQRETLRTPHISPDGVKVFLDGIPVPPRFTHVPIDADGFVDETNLLVPRALLKEKLIEWDSAGLKVKMHASADGAARVGLDAIEATRKANGMSDVFHETGHSAEVADADLGRYGPLNAVAEISPYFWHLGGVVGGTGYQFRSLHNQGALITVGSDYPVVKSFNPFPPLQGILERNGESVPLATAIEFFTRNGAESIGRLHDLGTLEVGKRANMVVLDRNVFEVAVQEIASTTVVRTILDGKDVYSAEWKSGLECCDDEYCGSTN